MVQVCLVNNLVTFSEKSMGFEELPNRMVEALDIFIDGRPKRKPRKMES